jgi:hypothetical protein
MSVPFRSCMSTSKVLLVTQWWLAHHLNRLSDLASIFQPIFQKQRLIHVLIFHNLPIFQNRPQFSMASAVASSWSRGHHGITLCVIRWGLQPVVRGGSRPSSAGAVDRGTAGYTWDRGTLWRAQLGWSGECLLWIIWYIYIHTIVETYLWILYVVYICTCIIYIYSCVYIYTTCIYMYIYM